MRGVEQGSGQIEQAGVAQAVQDHLVQSAPLDEIVTRSIQRAAWFQTLPQPLREACAAAWCRHREAHGVSLGTGLSTDRVEHAMALPDTGAFRDEAFLDQVDMQLPGFAVRTWSSVWRTSGHGIKKSSGATVELSGSPGR
ncbi:hypothetical protein OG230_02270 [Streptomyces sp. NBC_00234]|uniref:hypothetical protein n=1 Tax=Streptomyces sp. NBC_00234 TaxID=2903638 RepID=UPI002E28B8C6|nr:hypothetical protein [Streptomyces sp. NBC_00234]